MSISFKQLNNKINSIRFNERLVWTAIKSIIQIITGNAPLILTNAVNNSITSLTQYGLCTQATTPAPTPSAPVDIMCNNGTLTAVDDDLPAGYKRVHGFSVNDDCYWRLTDFKLNGSDTLRLAFSVTAACNVIGAYSGNASGNNLSLYVATSGTGKYLRYKDRAYNSVIDTNTRYDVAITPTGSVGMKTDSTWNELSFTTMTDFCIGTTSTNTSSAKLKGSLFGNITVDGRLNLVPCECISDGVLGYYDLVGEAFYTPTSGTPTSLGYDYDHVHVEVVGTPEVMTLSASGATDQTAIVESLLSVSTVADEQNIISGAVIRRCAACCYNGTQTIGDVYISTTGGKDVGAIIVYPLDEPTTEQITGQNLVTNEGTNTVDVTAEVSPIELKVKFSQTKE